MTADELLALVGRYDAWVYALLMAYSLAKTGPLPMVAGFLSYGGTLNVALVVGVVLGGTLIGSHLRFAIGRGGAPWLFDRLPRFAPWLALGAAAVERYQWWLLPAYRFAKGIFTLVTLGAGASALPWKRFVLPDAFGAMAWTAAWVGAGFLIGAMGEVVDPRWAAYIGLSLLGAGIVATAVFGRRLRRVLLPHANSALAQASRRRRAASA